ncbi:uncharacterized protein LOC114518343 [Dendronephthya gigantea]|uniref:uncharacterized protein LOC114518343 n=1 Tax=Dendronephthya gigantea TaxID=151771 RepID=UPI00106D7D7B|nr:uncharacterized protein LOC114518343 [Dendronephthya gigantea]
MKGTIILILLIQCFVAYGKPRSQRLVKRQINPSFNLAAYLQEQLNLHNHYRQLHGVPPLVLDPVLTKEAQNYADNLKTDNVFQHCGATVCNPSGAGESLANVLNATELWYNEVHDYNYCSFPQGRATTRPGSEGKMIFHFTQVVWATTRKLGIGFAKSADGKKTYVVARYTPAGNFFGQFKENVPIAAYLTSKYQPNCNGVSGGLGEWSQPGSCSKSCGKGIRYQTRSCNNPKPSYNGRDCSGVTKRIHPFWCNSQACAVTVNERAEECKAKGYSALSYNFGGAHDCTLFCLEPNLSNFYYPRGKVSDGTLCKDGRGACIDGVCAVLGDEPTTPAPATTSPPVITQAPATNGPGTTQGPTNQPAAGLSTTPPPTTPALTTTQPPTTTSPPTTPPTTFPPLLVNGGYSEWSKPGLCSRTCGGGVRFRTRTCLVPQNRGGCVGPAREAYKVWCNAQPCDPPIPQRNSQCQLRGHEPEGHNFGGVDECYLYCRDSQSGYFFYRGTVELGTPCNKSAGACVDNVCVPMAYEPGTVISGIYTNVPSSEYWKNIIVAVPNGATNVQIIHNNHDAEAVVGYRSNTAYGYDASSVVKGVRVRYHINSDITIDGPVRPTPGHQIIVYALGETQADIVFRYTPPAVSFV